MSEKNTSAKTRKCGIVMPISAIDGLGESHWLQVKEIIMEAVSIAGLEGDLVSNSNEVNFIHSTIVNNLYSNDLVIVDVSAKNPNVMFELGIRLTFDKPTIIIKDNETNYSFDTSPIEHIGYPRDLNYSAIVNFKNQLKEKIISTIDKAENDKNYSPFLKRFGNFITPRIEKREVDFQEFVLRQLDQFQNELMSINNSIRRISEEPERSISTASSFPMPYQLPESKSTQLGNTVTGLIDTSQEKEFAQLITTNEKFKNSSFEITPLVNEKSRFEIHFTNLVTKPMLKLYEQEFIKNRIKVRDLDLDI